MVIKRKSDRRRRLMVDSASTTTAAPTPTKSIKNADTNTSEMLDARRAYAIGAERRHQRKITDLIPKRPLAYTAAVAAVATVLICVNLLAYFSPAWHAIIGDAGVQSLSLTGPTTIATWLATICLAAAGSLCLPIYALRQHRSDDYEGSYRIWGWLAIVFAVGSLACIVPVGQISENMFTALSGRTVTTAWLPTAIGVSLVSLLLIRYLMEVRSSLGTVAWASIAWLAISLRLSSAGLLTSLLPASVDQSQATSFVWGNGLLVAAAAFLLANLTYGRFVFLRANGFVAAKPKQIKQAKSKLSRSARQTSRRRSLKTPTKKTDQTNTSPRREKNNKPTKTSDQTVATNSRKRSTKAKQTPVTAPAAIKTSAKIKPKQRAKTKSAPASPEPEILKMPSVADAGLSESAKPISESATAKLKKMADAARAKSNAMAATPDSESSDTTSKKLSKAERRRQRKLLRQQKRAA